MITPQRLGRTVATIPLTPPAPAVREALQPCVARGVVSADFRTFDPLRSYHCHVGYLDRLRPHRGTGRLLEIGCGIGLLSHAAALDGWEVAGIEPSEPLAAFARLNLGLDVRIGSAAAVPCDPATFDAVVLIDTDRLLPDLPEVVRQVARVLRPGGAFLVSAPNPDGLARRLDDGHEESGPSWSLLAALAAVGLEPLDVDYGGSSVADVVRAHEADRDASLRIAALLERSRDWRTLAERLEVLARRADDPAPTPS